MRLLPTVYFGSLAALFAWSCGHIVHQASLVYDESHPFDPAPIAGAPAANGSAPAGASAAARSPPAAASAPQDYALPAGLASRLGDTFSHTPDSLARGAAIASGGIASAGVAACAGCHGAEGHRPASVSFPSLAGEPAWYLAKQIADYAGGARTHPLMSPLAQALGAEDRLSVALYYASLPGIASVAPAAVNAEQRTRGLQLLESGDNAKGLQGCANCHGPSDAGIAPGGPALRNQSPDYVRAQLAAWKSGARRNDVAGLMRAVAARLDDADIEAVAAAIAGEPEPLPLEVGIDSHDR